MNNRRNNRTNRLLVGENVEVRQLDEGLRGSWHIGRVVGVSLHHRDVRYEHLLEDDGITKCIERIEVSDETDGSRTSINSPRAGCRGRIRPLPPVSGRWATDLCYGLCVDASYEDGWWEGVIFDHDVGSEERAVFFPDEGDELRLNVKKLRVTRDWDEEKGDWNVRGAWVFLKSMGELTRESGTVSRDWIKQLWSLLRQQDTFLAQISEWTLGEPSLWRKLMKQVSNFPPKRNSTYGDDAVEVILKDDDVHKRRRVGNPSEQYKKFRRRPHRTHCNGSNAEVIRGHTDGQEGCPALVRIQPQIAGSILSDWAPSTKEVKPDFAHAVEERSDAPTSLSMVVSVENAVCKSLPGDIGNNMQALLDYATVWEETHCRRTKGVSDKARLQLKSAGWKVERKLSKDRVKLFQYVSPEGKYYNSLIGVCKDLIPSITDDSNGSTDRETDALHEQEAARKAGIASQQLGRDIVLKKAVLIDNQDSEQRVIEERAYRSNKELEIEPSTAEPSGEDVGDDGVVSGKVCGRQAIMEYVRLIDEKKKSKGVVLKKLVDEVRMRAKEHLLAMGWTFKRERKSKERKELHYFTPQGKRFMSFYVACCAYDQLEEMYESNHNRSEEDMIIASGEGWFDKEDEIPSKKDQRRNSQSPDEALVQSVGDMLVQSSCVEPVNDELDTFVSGPLPPLDMEIPPLEYDLVDTSERRSPDNQKDGEQRAQVRSLPHQTIPTIFADAADGFLERSIHCHEHRTQTSFDLPSTVPLASSTDELEALSTPVSLLNEEENQNPVATGSHDGVPVYSQKGPCTRHHKVQKAPTPMDQSPKIRVKDQVCFPPQSLAVEAIPEHGSVPRVHRPGRPLRCRKRKRGMPLRTYLTCSYNTTRNLALPSKRHNIKTALSWLIDNEVVLPRQKVYYIGKKNNRVMAEGRISYKGILCRCCAKIYTLSSFEAHAGSNNHRPSAHIFLKDGRSLQDCQMELLSAMQPNSSMLRPCRTMKVKDNQSKSDSICSICHYGGSLILCDQCPSSFHLTCVNLKVLPNGKWFCPCCRCAICGQSDFNDANGEFAEKMVKHCGQCRREYHVGCWSKREKKKLESCPLEHWFCSMTCSKIFMHLHKLLGKPKPTSFKGLHWTILRFTNDLCRNDASVSETMTEFQSKISLALDVLHECFVPIIEQRTKSDLVSDVLFNRSSDLNRLNFEGFYTMLLEKGDELVSVATIRIHGRKVAEMPLIGTRVQYRCQGMCRLLVTELENMLAALGVERLILPAAPLLKEIWVHSFGFMEMTSKEISELSGFTFLNFQDATMCQKLLKVPRKEKRPSNTLMDASQVKCCDATTNLSSEDITDSHVQATNRRRTQIGTNENCFLTVMPEQSSFLTTGDQDLASSLVRSPQDEALVSAECELETINGNCNMQVNTNTENIAGELVQRCSDDFFVQIYRRGCTRLRSENVKRIKRTAFCN